MAVPSRRRVTLEFELGADPVQGRIVDPPGATFAGWLQLAQALEAALAAALEPPTEEEVFP